MHYTGNIDELDLRNRSVKKSLAKSTQAKSRGDSPVKKVINKVRNVSKKHWIILIIITTLLLTVPFIAKWLVNKKPLDSLFCQKASEKVFYGDDDCEKVFSPEECKSIQVKKCMPCPDHAHCENGNMDCNEGYEKIGNLCLDEHDTVTNEFVRYLHKV